MEEIRARGREIFLFFFGFFGFFFPSLFLVVGVVPAFLVAPSFIGQRWGTLHGTTARTASMSMSCAYDPVNSPP